MAILKETTIKVVQNTDAIVKTRHTVVDQSVTPAVRTAYDFTGVTEIEFILKKTVKEDAPLKTYKMTANEVSIVGLPTDGELSTQMDAATLATAGPVRFRIDVIKAGKRDCIMAGPFVIEDT